MSDLTQRLREKGWTEEDIYKALSIIERGDLKKSKKIAFLDSIIYWIVLFVALIGNFIISIILIPFMLAMSGLRLYAIIIIIGMAFGAFFDLLIRDIEKIQKKDVIIAGIFLPLLALINVSLMVNFANHLQKTLGLITPEHSSIIIGIIYVFAFVAPYIIRSVILIKQGKKNIAARL